MKKIFEKFSPLFFIFLLWFVFASPYFLKNKVPYPSTYQVNFGPPWSYYQQFWGPVKNNAMPDIVGQIYPWRHFSINMLREGEVAFWNPYGFSGTPHLANYQSAVFSPLNFLFFLPISFIDAWSIIVLLQPLMAAFFAYFLMKEFKVSSFGSLISSIAFMFSGFMVVWMAYGTMSLAIAFLPLTLLALEKSFKKSNLWLLVLILSFPLSFFSGHFQTSLYFLIFTFLFFIFKALQTKDKKKAFTVLLSIIVGLAISLVQILPSVEFYLHSVRSEIFIRGGIGIPFNYLVTMFAPDFFGNPVTRNDWFGYYAEWASFIGIAPLLLSFFALMSKKRILPLFFTFSAFLFLLLAIESPIINLISFLKIPVLSTSNPTRIIVLFSFSVAVLAGFGFDNLKSLILEKRIKKIIPPFLLIGALFLFIWISLFLIKVLPSDKLFIAKRNFFLPTIIFLLTTLLVLLSFRFKKLVLIFSFYLLLITSFDSFRFIQKWMPADPKKLVFAEIPIISAIKKNIGNGRYFGNLGDQVTSFYGLSSIEGYDPLYIQRYGEFITSAGSGQFAQAERSVVRLSRGSQYTNRVLDLLGVNLIFHPIADTNQGWAYPVWEDKARFSLVYKDDKFQLFKNNLALDRATLFYDYEVITDQRKIIERFYQEDFPFRTKLILEEDPNISLKSGSGSAKIVGYAPNKVIVETTTDQPAFLF
ncbi:MAG: YfhO family protein, partial [bacterium]|nr:YfhO family protein [bacterium]